MKRVLSILFFTFLSISLSLAQTDEKYLEGAVPVVDGKVTFTNEVNAGTMSKQQVYDILLEWANKRYQPDDNLKARVLYTNPEEGIIAIGGEEYLVFSSTALALDRTRIYYQLQLFCETGKCKIILTRIRYWYEENRDGGVKYNAEEWITDEFSLQKNKKKLYPISGKFRRKTIDLKEELTKEIQSILAHQMMAIGSSTTPVAAETPVNVKTPSAQPQQQPTTDTATGTTPQNETSLVEQAARLTITAGNDEQFEISKECWGGFGELFGKKVAFCLIDTQKTMGNMLMVQSDSYKITFYSNNNTPILVIHCKKLMTQNIKGEEAQKMNANCIVEKSYNMYVGEILK